MLVEPDPSTFRVEKTRADAIITLSNGESARGCFFVSRASAHSVGPELVGELLNGESGFFPFEVHDDRGVHTVLFNRIHVVTVALPDNEARFDPGYDVATRRFVSVLLSNGHRLAGSVRVYRPQGRDRLSDWARHPHVFRYVEAEAVTFAVNTMHVIEVRETAADA
jgi:hypothetical protein